MKNTRKIDFLELAKQGARIADSKKGSDIVILNVRRLTILSDYFLIAAAESAPQMKAIADTIEKTFSRDLNLKLIHKDGSASSSWIVLDYGGLVIHLMSPSTRILYALERIWNQARRVKFNK